VRASARRERRTRRRGPARPPLSGTIGTSSASPRRRLRGRRLGPSVQLLLAPTGVRPVPMPDDSFSYFGLREPRYCVGDNGVTSLGSRGRLRLGSRSSGGEPEGNRRPLAGASGRLSLAFCAGLRVGRGQRRPGGERVRLREHPRSLACRWRLDQVNLDRLRV
jgi:hypothetical protein